VVDPRRARRRQRFGDAQRLAGRVAKEDRLEERAAGVPSSETVASIASRRPAALKRSQSTAGLIA
jgi:hypothetical protein